MRSPLRSPAQVEGPQGVLPQPEKDLERPSSTRLEARFPYCQELAYCILSAALSTASSFRIWNSSTGILSLPGASVRSSTHDKGHEEEGSAYAKAGSSLRSPPGNSQSLPTFCFVLSPTPLTLRG